MKLKIAVAGALVAGFVLPAVSQAADEYYLVQTPRRRPAKSFRRSRPAAANGR